MKSFQIKYHHLRIHESKRVDLLDPRIYIAANARELCKAYTKKHPNRKIIGVKLA